MADTKAAEGPGALEPSTLELRAAFQRRRGPLYGAGAVALALGAVSLYVVLAGEGRSPAEPAPRGAILEVAADGGAGAGEGPVPDAGELPAPTPPPVAVAPEDVDGGAPTPAEPPLVLPPQPARKMGQLKVVTTFRGESYWAYVLVNGKALGRTPVLLELPAGTHRVRIERPRFRPVEKRVRIVAGRSTSLPIKLLR